MAAVVTYAYYRDRYHGTEMPEVAFDTWGLRAEERLSADTCGRSDGVLLAALAAECAQGAVAGVALAGQTVISTPQSVSPLGEQTRRAVCAVADALYHANQEERARGPLLRESVGSWSRSYAVREAREITRQVRAAEALYLGGTGLLYRGR